MKKVILVLVVMVVLFSYGCELLGARERPGLVPEKVDYHTGTQGLVVNVIKDQPPKEIWKGRDFIVGLELKNAGAASIKDGVIGISGFRPAYIQPSEDRMVFDLEGRSPANPTGDYKVINFRFSNVANPDKDWDENFKITAEYDYETEATAIVCIDPDILGITKHVCQAGEVGLRGGQGAPVAVTRVVGGSPIEVSIDELEVWFNIYFQEAGSGEIYEKVEDGQKKKEVTVKEVKLAGKNLQCEQNVIQIKEGAKEQRIRCFTKIKKTQGAYTAPLIIRLSYRYQYEEYRTVRIII